MLPVNVSARIRYIPYIQVRDLKVMPICKIMSITGLVVIGLPEPIRYIAQCYGFGRKLGMEE